MTQQNQDKSLNSAMELLIDNGRAAMFYVGTPPWHRIRSRTREVESEPWRVGTFRQDCVRKGSSRGRLQVG